MSRGIFRKRTRIECVLCMRLLCHARQHSLEVGGEGAHQCDAREAVNKFPFTNVPACAHDTHTAPVNMLHMFVYVLVFVAWHFRCRKRSARVGVDFYVVWACRNESLRHTQRHTPTQTSMLTYSQTHMSNTAAASAGCCHGASGKVFRCYWCRASVSGWETGALYWAVCVVALTVYINPPYTTTTTATTIHKKID